MTVPPPRVVTTILGAVSHQGKPVPRRICDLGRISALFPRHRRRMGQRSRLRRLDSRVFTPPLPVYSPAMAKPALRVLAVGRWQRLRRALPSLMVVAALGAWLLPISLGRLIDGDEGYLLMAARLIGEGHWPRRDQPRLLPDPNAAFARGPRSCVPDLRQELAYCPRVFGRARCRDGVVGLPRESIGDPPTKRGPFRRRRLRPEWRLDRLVDDCEGAMACRRCCCSQSSLWSASS